MYSWVLLAITCLRTSNGLKTIPTGTLNILDTNFLLFCLTQVLHIVNSVIVGHYKHCYFHLWG